MTEEQKKEETAEEINKEAAAVEDNEPNKKDSKYKAENKKLWKEIDSLKAENKKLETSAADSNDKYLRLAAEYDNFRKRSVKERENVYADAYNEALSEFLPVLDNLERAKTFTDEANLAKGLEAIRSQVDTAMEKLGITAFGEVGETFDPSIHNAVMHIEDEKLGENVIASVFQKGYKKGDRIIRHAMVQVAN